MELGFAAELMGGEMTVRKCSNGVLVPDAEIVLEGYIGAELTEEGPFVDITGTYDPVRMQPVIEITGMYTKPDFIYHGILPGGDEHKMLMGAPYEPKIFKAVAGVTEVRNVVLTKGGCGYLHAVIQIKKSTQGDAKNAIMAAFAAHTSLKHVVVIDEDIDPDRSERGRVRDRDPGQRGPGHHGHHRCPGLIARPVPARRRDQREGRRRCDDGARARRGFHAGNLVTAMQLDEGR